MFSQLVLLSSLAVYTTGACNINAINNTQICVNFIKFIYKSFNTLSVDLVYSLPSDNQLKALITVRNILKHMMEADLIIKPNQIYGHRNIFIDTHYTKNLWIILENTIDMNQFLEDIQYYLNVTSQWVFLGTGEMTWIKHVELSFNSQVYIAHFRSQFVDIKEAYRVNGIMHTRTLMKWFNTKNEKDLIYLASTMYQRDMAGVILKIIIFHDPPFVILENNITARGFLIDLWNIIEKGRQFKTEIVYATSVSEDSTSEGYSTSLLKEAQHSDIILMLRRDSKNFSHIFDASTSILTLRLAIYQRIQRPYLWQLITQMSSYAIPFIIFSYGLLCVIFLRFYGQQTSDSIMTVVTVFVQQVCTLIPRNLSSRIAVLSILLLSTYIVIANLGDVTSLIINKTKTKKLTLYDMLDPALKVIIVQHSAVHNMMRANKTILLGQILSRIELNNGFVSTIYDGLKRVTTDGVILLEMKERVAYYFQEFDCYISQTITDFHTPTGFLVNWTLPYKNHLDFDIINMKQNGLMSQLKQKWWPDKTRNCMDRFETVRLKDCWQLFAIFIEGSVLAVLVFIVEKYYHNT